jgi:hypothetical protein
VVAGSVVERYIRSNAHVVSTFDGSNNWRQNFVWNDEVDGITMLEQADVLDYDTDTNTSEVRLSSSSGGFDSTRNGVQAGQESRERGRRMRAG